MITQKTTKNFQFELNDLKFKLHNNRHMAILIDAKGYEILNGYGSSPVEALNDLHNNLI